MSSYSKGLQHVHERYMGGRLLNRKRPDDEATKVQMPLQMAKTSYGEILCVEHIQWLRYTELVQTSHHTRKANSDISDVH